MDVRRRNETARPLVSESVEPPSIRTAACHGAPSPLPWRSGWLIRRLPRHRIVTVGSLVAVLAVSSVQRSGCHDERGVMPPSRSVAPPVDPVRSDRSLDGLPDGLPPPRRLPRSAAGADRRLRSSPGGSLRDRRHRRRERHRSRSPRPGARAECEPLQAVRLGEWNWCDASTTATLDNDTPAGDTMRRTVGACVEAMIVVSDNACGVAGLRLLGGGSGGPAAATWTATSRHRSPPRRRRARLTSRRTCARVHYGTLLGSNPVRAATRRHRRRCSACGTGQRPAARQVSHPVPRSPTRPETA